MKVGFILVVLFITFLSVSKAEDPQKQIPEVEKAIEVITKTTDALSSSQFSKFFEKATEVAKQFSSFLQELNKLVKIGIEIVNTIKGVKEEDPLEKLKQYIGEQFAIVNGRLELIENKIDQVNLVFQDELAANKLREYLHRRDNILDMLESFSKNPNNITTAQLKKVCAENSMRGFINFLNAQIMDGGEGSLLAAMKRGNVRKNFYQWSKNIYGFFVEANVLYTQCFTATYFKEYDETEFNITLKADTEKFQETLKKMTRKLESEHNEFLKVENYMNWAKQDLKEMMKRHRGMEHEKFSKLVTNHFTDKYDWRAWVVGSYSGDTRTFNEHAHTLTQNTITVFREESRSVFVFSHRKFDESSPEKKNFEQFAKKIAHFVFSEQPHKTISHERCINMVDIIETRFPGLQMDCVRSDRALKVSNSPGALFTTFTVTTYEHNGKTRTFNNQFQCDNWVHYNLRGPYPGGLPFIPQACAYSTMNFVVSQVRYM